VSFYGQFVCEAGFQVLKSFWCPEVFHNKEMVSSSKNTTANKIIK
jgi:hypothetical protein